jgi:hypothetical protein
MTGWTDQGDSTAGAQESDCRWNVGVMSVECRWNTDAAKDSSIDYWYVAGNIHISKRYGHG